MRLPVSALRRLLQLLAVAVVFFAVAREARAEEVPLPVILYTIGPSDELPSRYGHSFLCLREAGKDTPLCANVT